MKINQLIAALPFLLLQSPVFSQKLFTTVNMQEAYKKETRSADGRPGKKYWQNRGDYQIRVQFDPSTQLLTGEEIISYTNNSPDSLKKLIIRLLPDYYKKGVHRASNIADKDLGEGVILDQLIIRNDTIHRFDDPKRAVRNNVNLIVTPLTPVLPGSKTDFIISASI
jgi:hypothetical protein